MTPKTAKSAPLGWSGMFRGVLDRSNDGQVLRLMLRALSYWPARHGSLALEDDQAMSEISFAAPKIGASQLEPAELARQ